jgi:NAD(P)H-dependent flavin oxidoreductase YrpB (nitropropane dioxygenase family)
LSRPDTYYKKLFDIEWPDAAHRVLRNKIVENWEAAGSPASGQRPGEGDIAGRMPIGGQIVELPRYSVFMPMEGFEGDLDAAALYCGESCSLISDVRPAAEIVRTLAADADAVRKSTAG